MTARQDVQRAGLRVMMAESLAGVPDHSADPRVFARVGSVSGGSSSNDERQVRASDSRDRFRLPENAPVVSPEAPNLRRWSVAVGTLACAVGTLWLVAYLCFPT
jgi:hypothetical protein